MISKRWMLISFGNIGTCIIATSIVLFKGRAIESPDLAELRRKSPGIEFDFNYASESVVVTVDHIDDVRSLPHFGGARLSLDVKMLELTLQDWSGAVELQNLVSLRFTNCSIPAEVLEAAVTEKTERLELEQCTFSTAFNSGALKTPELTISKMSLTDIQPVLDRVSESIRELRLSAIVSDSPLALALGDNIRILEIGDMRMLPVSIDFVGNVDSLSLVQLNQVKFNAEVLEEILSCPSLEMCTITDSIFVDEGIVSSRRIPKSNARVVLRLDDEDFERVNAVLGNCCRIERVEN